jgi:hypothetical protein
MQILRKMQRDKLKAMTAEQRTAYIADLTKRWTALPPADKLKLKAAALQWRADHPRPDRPEGACPPADNGH